MRCCYCCRLQAMEDLLIGSLAGGRQRTKKNELDRGSGRGEEKERSVLDCKRKKELKIYYSIHQIERNASSCVKYISAVGDPGMRRDDLRVAIDSWNQCNEVGDETPNMGSPRAANCFDIYRALPPHRGGPSSQFYLMDMGSCWKNNGQPCDGDVTTDVTPLLAVIT
ncbi:hypothetical protein HHK36_023495 [Tetracentron sinense]|uniref:DUF7705 domain-containing protein n=1 Tax=Tetracentron sinense TaxID=13715 RepID=A0A834YRB3_TETSI|nr:hypothetical protein HHK36_023495 [Tetracentron sinense]